MIQLRIRKIHQFIFVVFIILVTATYDTACNPETAPPPVNPDEILETCVHNKLSVQIVNPFSRGVQ